MYVSSIIGHVATIFATILPFGNNSYHNQHITSQTQHDIINESLSYIEPEVIVRRIKTGSCNSTNHMEPVVVESSSSSSSSALTAIVGKFGINV